MNENDLIILDNDERYSLLKEINLDGEKYYMAAAVNEKDLVQKDKICYFRADEEDGELFVDLVTNENLIIELTKELEKEAKKDANN